MRSSWPVVVTGPVRTFSALPLHPSVPQPLLRLKPVTSVAFSVQVTRIVYWFSAVAVTSVGAAGALPPDRGVGDPVAPGDPR